MSPASCSAVGGRHGMGMSSHEHRAARSACVAAPLPNPPPPTVGRGHTNGRGERRFLEPLRVGHVGGDKCAVHAPAAGVVQERKVTQLIKHDPAASGEARRGAVRPGGKRVAALPRPEHAMQCAYATLTCSHQSRSGWGRSGRCSLVRGVCCGRGGQGRAGAKAGAAACCVQCAGDGLVCTHLVHRGSYVVPHS